MSKAELNTKMAAFRRRLSESSPLEAPIKGFNRIDREMSPATRELVLQARLPEIMAFADDRRLNPAIVAGVVEAAMRLGRIPDVGMYGLSGDEGLAVKDFVASCMLGLEAELAAGLPQINETHDKHARHKGYSDHYRKLANHHQQAIEFHTQAASKANKSGAPFTAAKHQAKVGLLKQLHASHAALADYHDCEAKRFQPQLPAVPEGAGPTHVDQPTGQGERPAHPQPGSTAAQAPVIPRQEQTTSASLSPFAKMPSGYLQRSGIKPLHSKWKKEEPDDDETKVEHRSKDGFFKKIPMIDEMLTEAEKSKKKKAAAKKRKKDSESSKAVGFKADPDKVLATMANVRCAPLFQQLGHKMDHVAAKMKNKKDKKIGSEWTDKLHKLCLSKGASAAADEVIKSSLSDPWIRDQGFVDEASNLRRKWETMMSAETQENALKASATSPQPIVFTINRMLDMAQGKGSIY